MLTSSRNGIQKRALEISVWPRPKRHAYHKPKWRRYCFFLSEGTCSFLVSWTRSNSEAALLLGSTGNVTWCVLETPKLLHDAWILHHDNAPDHDVLAAPEFLSKTFITILNCPPYLPDLDQHIFWLVQKLTTILKGQWFLDIALKRHAVTILKNIPEEGFQ